MIIFQSQTYRNERLSHTTLPLNVVLARDLVAVLHALTTLETETRNSVSSKRIGGIIRVQNVDAPTCIILSTSVGRKDLDGIVDSR